VEQKLDEIALAISELARYVEDIEKDNLSRSPPHADAHKALWARGERLRRSLAPRLFSQAHDRKARA